MFKPLDLTVTAQAYDEYERASAEHDKRLYRVKTTGQYAKWAAREAAIIEKLHQAFYQDTKDRNHLDQVRHVHPLTIGRWVNRWRENNNLT